jgi:hypothetical protein
MNPRKKVAAIVTEYRRFSHADVIVGKILEGFDQQGGPGPDLQLVSMYVDQFPEKDMSRDLAPKYGFRIIASIEEALTLGGDRLAVDGVLSIGEHGKYPTNEKGQILYPRRRFFEGIVAAFERCRQVVPVFNDKHLAAVWSDAKWMYDKARELFIPFMAGSSLPVTWRVPPLTLPRGCRLREAVALGYGPTEGYGFHTLEVLQCMVERRQGGETGVSQVQYLSNETMWQVFEDGRVSQETFEAGLATIPGRIPGDYRAMCSRDKSAGVFLVDYRDGLRAAAFLLNGCVVEGKSAAFAFAGRLADQDKPAATHFHLQSEPPFGHFGYLLKAIEHMIQTNHPAYPVERTLLTTGILDAGMTSRHLGGQPVPTPHLDIRYEGSDWPHAPGPPPPPKP